MGWKRPCQTVPGDNWPEPSVAFRTETPFRVDALESISTEHGNVWKEYLLGLEIPACQESVPIVVLLLACLTKFTQVFTSISSTGRQSASSLLWPARKAVRTLLCIHFFLLHLQRHWPWEWPLSIGNQWKGYVVWTSRVWNNFASSYYIAWICPNDTQRYLRMSNPHLPLPRGMAGLFLRYVVDGDGELQELVGGERPDLEELWADSQVSSGWLSAAYRTLKEPFPEPPPAKNVVDLTESEDHGKGEAIVEDGVARQAESTPSSSGSKSTPTCSSSACVRPRSRSRSRKWNVREFEKSTTC